MHRAEWWDRATPEQIGHAHQVATAWAQEDPDAAHAGQRIRDEVRSRYGIDVDNAGADPEAVRQRIQIEVDRSAAAQVAADIERSRAAAENVEARRLHAHSSQEEARADQARAAAECEPDPTERERAAHEAAISDTGADWARDAGLVGYDSAERREATARDLEASGVERDLVATKMHADVSHAKPATEAVGTGRTSRAAKVRKTRGRTAQYNAPAWTADQERQSTRQRDRTHGCGPSVVSWSVRVVNR
ncbi:MAG: hypothetical protein ACTHW7_05900 [Actinomycetaceae bacterium]